MADMELKENTVRGLVILTIIPSTDIIIGDNGRREMFVEIARLESGFHTDPGPGSAGEIGLWQIHPVHFPALQRLGIVGTNPARDLTNAVTNARAAAYVYNQQGFSAWTTADEASRQVVSRGNADLEASEDRANEWVTEQMGGNIDFGPIDLITNPGQVIDNLPNVPGFGWVEGLTKFLSVITSADFWKRVGLGALGIGVLIAAIIFYNKDEIQDTVGAIK